MNTAHLRDRLKAFDFSGLLIEELGWNRHSSALVVTAGDVEYSLAAVAEKRGFVVYVCASRSGGAMPTYPARRKIHTQVAKTALEHIIVFVDGAKQSQVWQWVRREGGRRAYREYTFDVSMTGQRLAERVANLAFAFEEEEKLNIVDVGRRVGAALDVEKVTKKFYDRFKKEHADFLGFIKGIQARADQEWYASLMLNRMMFIYFIQKRGFLDGDQDYLRSRLRRMQELPGGKGKFHRFYRLFLLRLFHEGLAQPEAERAPELARLLGEVPYLNGGLFEVHDLERDNPEIQIPDEAFEQLFDFFDAYDWHLDERPRRADNEINPDVLGYIFEKYINQKQMGAYYTKEDITGYISRNTIIPWLFEVAQKECPIAFTPGGGVWRLLQDDPDRYVYEAVRKGADLKLPDDIAAGLKDVAKRGAWNRLAGAEFANPTETWREHVARRDRCLDLRKKLKAGKVTSIDDLVSHDLDIERFALDVIEDSEGPELVRAFWKAIQSVSVLDPTCGSGAFLFAALNILEPLYTACLDGMQGFLDDLERTEKEHHPDKLKPFRRLLEQVGRHPNRRYFVLKSLVIDNLYGVDIMQEAVEICKLRLFLKLVAQLESPEQIEPLPDIDFNIRTGNTLVGYASLEEVKRGMEGDMVKLLELPAIEERAELADKAFGLFRRMQSELGMDSKDFITEKGNLRKRLEALRTELDRFLCSEYGVNPTKLTEFKAWRTSHQPFHWVVEFYGIMKSGGFDVIVGNPPFVEYGKVQETYQVHHYRTQDCRNLYAFVLERSASLVIPRGRLGLIVPIALVSVGETLSARRLILERCSSSWFSNFAIRPAKLFEGVEQRLTILLAQAGGSEAREVFTTKYNQWYKDERPTLFHRLEYCTTTDLLNDGSIPKVGSLSVHGIVTKVGQMRGGVVADDLVSRSRDKLFFHRTPGYWIRIMDFEPRFRSPTATRSIHHIRELAVRDKAATKFIGAVISSSLYFLWFFAVGNCRNLTLEDVKLFRTGQPASEVLRRAGTLFDELMDNFQENSFMSTRGDTEFQEFDWGVSKPIIDRIDAILAQHYGLTSEELDFVTSYDIKIRMGREAESEDESEA